MPRERKRIIDFAQETAERGDALMETVTYKAIAGPNPCVRTFDWNGFDLQPPSFSEPSHGKTIWELPNLTDAWYVQEWTHPLLEQARIRAQMGARVKLWHDDVRHPPDESWLWARTNADAMVVLGGCDVHVLSMDHDLGGSDIPIETLDRWRNQGTDPDYMAITTGETGDKLAEYIGSNDLFPDEIVIHSMNPVGAGNILGVFQKWAPRSERTCTIKLEPFRR